MDDEELFDLGFPWKEHWVGMPEFVQEDQTPWQTLNVHFRRPEDREAFMRLLGRTTRPTGPGRSIWFPQEEIGSYRDKRYRREEPLNPRYPVYIPSKGRWMTCHTMKALDRIGVPYRAVVEECEAEQYAEALGEKKILVQPTHGKGLVVTRNWIWNHAQRSGAHRFWTFDDNIIGLFRLNQNLKTPVADGTILRVVEDFVERYENVVIAGMNYFMFASRKTEVPPFYLNTRVYSNMLIQTDLKEKDGRPLRNEGFYNDDTDLCLRVLKDGRCTVLFNAFLIQKQTTMKVKGGMTTHYKGEGRYRMAKELRDKHPDVVTITKKWGRWQHHVDYRRFRRNKIKPRVPLNSLPLPAVDNFGMYLERDADKPVFLIGQAPSSGGGLPLEGKIGRRLAKLMGISEEEYLARTERTNLFDAFPGKNGKGNLWDTGEAAKRAEQLKDKVRNRRVVFLGRNVAAAFGCGKLHKLTWKRSIRLRADVALVPHPSGIVRWWNDERNRERASQFLKSALNGASK